MGNNKKDNAEKLDILGTQDKVFNRALTTFKLEGEVTSLSESSQGEV
jgi:hypothetical protein